MTMSNTQDRALAPSAKKIDVTEVEELAEKIYRESARMADRNSRRSEKAARREVDRYKQVQKKHEKCDWALTRLKKQMDAALAHMVSCRRAYIEAHAAYKAVVRKYEQARTREEAGNPCKEETMLAEQIRDTIERLEGVRPQGYTEGLVNGLLLGGVGIVAYQFKCGIQRAGAQVEDLIASLEALPGVTRTIAESLVSSAKSWKRKFVAMAGKVAATLAFASAVFLVLRWFNVPIVAAVTGVSILVYGGRQFADFFCSNGGIAFDFTDSDLAMEEVVPQALEPASTRFWANDVYMPMAVATAPPAEPWPDEDDMWSTDEEWSSDDEGPVLNLDLDDGDLDDFERAWRLHLQRLAIPDPVVPQARGGVATKAEKAAGLFFLTAILHTWGTKAMNMKAAVMTLIENFCKFWGESPLEELWAMVVNCCVQSLHAMSKICPIISLPEGLLNYAARLNPDKGAVFKWIYAMEKLVGDINAKNLTPDLNLIAGLRGERAHGLHLKETVPQLKAEIQRMLEKMETCIAQHGGTKKSGIRPEPYVVVIGGQPGIGKTVMLPLLTQGALAGIVPPAIKKLHDNDLTCHVYNKDSGQFWQGYHGQAAVCFDDLGQYVQAEGQEGQLQQFMQLVNSWKLPLNMATLTDKGNTDFESPLLIATTNCGYQTKWQEVLKPVVREVPAFLRRLHLTVEPVLKPEFAVTRPGLAHKVLDFPKYRLAMETRSDILGLMNDVWEFRIMEHSPNDVAKPTGQMLSSTELIMLMIASVRDRQSSMELSKMRLGDLRSQVEEVYPQANTEVILPDKPFQKTPRDGWYAWFMSWCTWTYRARIAGRYCFSWPVTKGLSTAINLVLWVTRPNTSINPYPMWDPNNVHPCVECADKETAAVRLALFHQRYGGKIRDYTRTTVYSSRVVSRYFQRHADHFFLVDQGAHKTHIRGIHLARHYELHNYEVTVHEDAPTDNEDEWVIFKDAARELGAVWLKETVGILLLTTMVPMVLGVVYKLVPKDLMPRWMRRDEADITASPQANSPMVEFKRLGGRTQEEMLFDKVAANVIAIQYDSPQGWITQGRGLLLHSNVAVIPSHYMLLAERHNVMRIVTQHGNAFPMTVKEYKDMVVPGSDKGPWGVDTVLIRIPGLLHSYAPDITGHLLGRDAVKRTHIESWRLDHWGSCRTIDHVMDATLSQVQVKALHNVPARTYNDTLRMVVPNADGMCGLPVFVRLPERIALFGIHIAGAQSAGTSYAARVDVDPLVVDKGASMQAATPVAPFEGNVAPVLPCKFRLGEPILPPCNKRPVPMSNALLKQAMDELKPEYKGATRDDLEDFRTAARTLMWKMGNFRARRGPCSFDEAVNGNSISAPLPSNTSTGHPLTSMGVTKKKQVKEDPVLMSKMREFVYGIVDDLKSGDEARWEEASYKLAYQDFLKKEVRSKDVPRLVSGCPMQAAALVRMYFLDFVEYVTVSGHSLGMCIKINPFGDDWHALASRLSRFGDKGLDGDFKAFDQCHYPEIMETFVEAAQDYYRGHRDGDDIRDMLFHLTVTGSMHINGRKYHVWDRGMPSGNPLTAALNTWCNMILHMVAFHRITGFAMEEFFTHVAVGLMGDDNVSVPVESIADRWTYKELARQFAVLGYEYTTADKTDVTNAVARPIGELTFLKRGFFRGADGRWVAPRELESLSKQEMWLSPGVSVTENTENILLELSLHPDEVWREYAPRYVEKLASLGHRPLWLPMAPPESFHCQAAAQVQARGLKYDYT